jgi:hypothetical protein
MVKYEIIYVLDEIMMQKHDKNALITDLPVNHIGKPQVDSVPDAISFVVDSSEHIQGLLRRARQPCQVF